MTTDLSELAFGAFDDEPSKAEPASGASIVVDAEPIASTSGSVVDAPAKSRRASIEGYVRGEIERIFAGRRGHAGLDDPRTRAVLARLRRAVTAEAGTAPEVWAHTLGLPDELIRDRTGNIVTSDDPTRAEIAVHLALVLWAIHQQSKDEPMHIRSVSFATAVEALVEARDKGVENDSMGPVERRFNALARAQTIDAMTMHARGLIMQLRDGNLAFDYGGFARDLLLFQFPEHRGRVRRGWGRDFQRARTASKRGQADGTEPVGLETIDESN